MGKRVVALASQSDDIKFVGGLEDFESREIGMDLGEACFIGPTGAKIWSATDLGEAVASLGPSVLVDFSNAEASTTNVTRAADLGLAIVMGTTGHSDEQMRRIVQSIDRNHVAAVISPNMSAGINVLLEACQAVARMVPDYDVEILEIHHNQKIDSPSGTALVLARQISEALGRDPDEVIFSGRSGKGKRKPDEVGIASLRAGDIVGDHTVVFGGVGERLELTHRAQSRDAFASGVLLSIRFVSEARPGVYSIMDVLKATSSG